MNRLATDANGDKFNKLLLKYKIKSWQKVGNVEKWIGYWRIEQ